MFKKITTISVIIILLLVAVVFDVPAVAKFIGINQDFKIRQGLDLQGGTQLVYETDLTKVAAEDQTNSVQGVVEVINRRVNALGVTEPTIQKTRDNSRVIVELPGIKNIDDAIKLIGETAQLEFREGIEGKSLENGKFKTANYDDWKEVGLTGANFKKAQVQFQQGSTAIVQEPEIGIEFDAEGRKIFAEVTGRNIDKPLAIFLDKQLLSAPNVNEKIDSDSAVIQGGFTLAEAKTLAIQLNAGALPVPIQLVSQNNIGATLGTEAVQKSVVAGLLGLLLVILFMILYYRLPGFLASLALIYYALLTMAIFIAVPVTLTLPGIAGFILSIGMAIDANILIFERMKEELRSGSPLMSAIDTGFKRAWTSIRDSNFSSLITAVILYYFGSGMIKGFAVTLGVGILVSLFTALTVTHVILRAMAGTGLKKKLNWWMGGVKS
ncbi:MAG: protein translocase subunit SecD [Patescibacteria group bacterium]|jgi:preprotein translocase subunit SecD